jgi:hypothetical protein
VDLSVVYRRDNDSSTLRAFLETVRAIAPQVQAPGHYPIAPVAAVSSGLAKL